MLWYSVVKCPIRVGHVDPVAVASEFRPVPEVRNCQTPLTAVVVGPAEVLRGFFLFAKLFFFLQNRFTHLGDKFLRPIVFDTAVLM